MLNPKVYELMHIIYKFWVILCNFPALNLRLNQNLTCSLNSTGTKNPLIIEGRDVSLYFLVREFCCCCFVCLFIFSPTFTIYFTSPFGNYFGGVLFTTWYSIWIFTCFNALRYTKNLIRYLHFTHSSPFKEVKERFAIISCDNCRNLPTNFRAIVSVSLKCYKIL